MHIRMADLRHEGHHGWRMRVVIGDFDVDFPVSALVGGSFDAFENCDEVCDVVFGDGLETVEAGVGVFVVVGELFHEASADGGDCGGGHGGYLVWGRGLGGVCVKVVLLEGCWVEVGA